MICRRHVVASLIALSLTGGLAACGSDADKVSKNLSKEAEQFKVVRRIVGINGITDKVEFEVTGRCSLEFGESMPDTLDVICKEGAGSAPSAYKKHYIKMSDNMFYISTQLQAVNVSAYRTKIVLKPENIIPDFDLVTGDRP